MNSRRTRFLLLGALAAVLVGTALLVWETPVVAQVRAALVKNVDEPWRTSWDTRSQFLPNAGGCFGTSDCYNYDDGPGYAVFELRPVPAGKRWVVVSATGGMVNAQGRTTEIWLGNSRGAIVWDGVRWIFAGPFQAETFSNAAAFNASVDATFGPGEVPVVRVMGAPSLAGYSVLVFKGYLIDAN